MKRSIEIMKDEIISILKGNIVAIYLFGSVTLNDFKLGWSDIDILCLTEEILTEEQAQQLVFLRQTLLDRENENLYFRSFEGAIVSQEEFQNSQYSKVVYWGTSGQRITDIYSFDSFSKYELIKDGILIYGRDIRLNLNLPTYNQLREEVIKHYNAIRTYAVKTNESLYSCGWLLDIARCIYTLRTGGIIAKTKAGEWALEQSLCPNEKEMLKTLEIRNNPQAYKKMEEIKTWLSSLGPVIQEFADVLEIEINRSIYK